MPLAPKKYQTPAARMISKVKNVRLGTATGAYKSNTLGETASLMKSTFNSLTKPKKK